MRAAHNRNDHIRVITALIVCLSFALEETSASEFSLSRQTESKHGVRR